MLTKKKDLPAMPFYFGDWRKAPEIRALDLDIRMIWFEMLGYMWESTERGYLTINGNSVTTPVIARLIGIDTPTMEKAIKQLEKYNVFSKRKSDGAIYCRKMITDEELRIKKSIAGQKGMESRYSDITPVITKPLTSSEDETETEAEDVKKDKKKKHKYGEYKNVLLTDIELQKIKDKFPNWEELIKKIDEGIEMKGYKYKSHYLAIVNVWSKNDKGDTVPKPKKEVNYYLYRCPVCQKEFRKREKKAEGVGGYECDEKKCQELLTNNQYRGHYLKLKDIILKKDQ